MPHGPIDRAISGQSRGLSQQAEGGPATPTEPITGIGGGFAEGEGAERGLLAMLANGQIAPEKLLELLQLLAGLGAGGGGGGVPQGIEGGPGGGGNPIEEALLAGGGP